MTETIYRLIEHEKLRAEKLHPYWPTDIIHAVSFVSEESGEATRAANNYMYELGDIEDVETELIHTAATCVRCLEYIRKLL